MIKSLRIRNFVLVRDVEIEFSEGLNILTGETGAGKSVIIGALTLLLGKKAKVGLFYKEDQPVYLEAIFSSLPQQGDNIALLQNEGYLNIEDEDRELLITREIMPDMTSKCYINGKRVTVSTVKELCGFLIDFHSQREQVQLFSPVYQLEVIDVFGNLREKRKTFTTKFKEVRKKIKKMSELETAEQQSAEKKRLYEYQIDELEELNLRLEEEKELEKELDLLTHAEEILNYCSEMQQSFYEKENSLFDQISAYNQRLERFKEDNDSIGNVVMSLASVLQLLTDVRYELRNIKENIDLDKSRMEQTEERLNSIIDAKNKYKMTVPQLLDYLGKMKKAVEEYVSWGEEISELKKEISILTDDLMKSADDLSLDRKQVSQELSAAIKKDIERLAIPEGDFKVFFENRRSSDSELLDLEGLDEYGKDKVTYLFSANTGVEMQPLKNIVSGGELSRLLLVVKKLLAGRLDTPSLVFDEIDSGIGGKIAKNLGEFISELGRYHQVLCITHLPQIAACSSRHFLIEKKRDAEKSYIEIMALSENERKEEIARMLAGTKSERAMKHAEELLNKE